MPAYGGLTITELEADMHKMHAEVDTKLSNCSKMIAKLDAHHNNADEHYRKADMLLAEHKVVIAALHNTLAAEKLPTVELKLRTAEYMLKCKTDDFTRPIASYLDAVKSDIRGKDAKKQLIKTMRSLTLQLAGKALPEEKDFKTENEKLKHELRILSAQLESKTEECETKDQIITDLTENFTVYQNVTPDTRIHRHDSCNELNVAFDEQCSVLTAERDIVQSNFEVLSVKHDVLAMKRDALGEECHNLRSKFNDTRDVHQKELEKLECNHVPQCRGSSSCMHCPMHLKRALCISIAAEAQALQLVDKVNHDRMKAWNQLHEHQTTIVKEHYAAVGSWMAAKQGASVSAALVSPRSRSDAEEQQGWNISSTSGLSDDDSVDFVL